MVSEEPDTGYGLKVGAMEPVTVSGIIAPDQIGTVTVTVRASGADYVWIDAPSGMNRHERRKHARQNRRRQISPA